MTTKQKTQRISSCRSNIPMENPAAWQIHVEAKHKEKVAWFCRDARMSISDFFNLMISNLDNDVIYKHARMAAIKRLLRDLQADETEIRSEARKLTNELQHLEGAA